MSPIEQLFLDGGTENPRERLEKLTQAMMGLPETYEPALSHYRADGLYGRRIYVPAGMCVATRVHKQEHLTIALKGQCLVVDENGNKGEVSAPAVFVTKPGTQRACLAITDVEWLTVHACDEVDDVTEMTARLTCKTFADYERMLPGELS
jgi:hypothetical protein